MLKKKVVKGYWKIKKHCQDEALKYKSKKIFRKNCGGAYSAAWEYGFLDEICSHMTRPTYEGKTWIIYSYIILNKYVYIGLTDNEKRRKREHEQKNIDNHSAIKKFIEKNNIKKEDIKYLVEVDNIKCSDTASILEGVYLNAYLKDGFIKINKAKTGSLGGGILIWTKEKCSEILKNYTKRSEFKKVYPTAYKVSCEKGWIDEFLPPREIIWTKEECKKVAIKCKNKKIFKNEYGGAYKASYKNNWLDEFFPNIKKINPRNYWTYEKCLERSKNYKNRSEFEQKESSAYRKSLKEGWIDKFFPDTIIYNNYPRGYWTYEKCTEVAKLCLNRNEFDIIYSGAYKASVKYGWLDEFFPKIPK